MSAFPGPTQDLVQLDRKPDPIWYQWLRALSFWQRNIDKRTDFAPLVTASAGAITAASATGFYSDVGPLRHFTIAIAITTNGTGSGALNVELPSAPVADFAGASGRESTQPFSVAGHGTAGNATLSIVKTSDGSYPAGDGYLISIQGSYRKV